MWWLTVTVYDMTWIVSLSHCVDCSLSVFSVFFYFHCIAFLPWWWINDIHPKTALICQYHSCVAINAVSSWGHLTRGIFHYGNKSTFSCVALRYFCLQYFDILDWIVITELHETTFSPNPTHSYNFSATERHTVSLFAKYLHTDITLHIRTTGCKNLIMLNTASSDHNSWKSKSFIKHCQ